MHTEELSKLDNLKFDTIVVTKEQFRLFNAQTAILKLRKDAPVKLSDNAQKDLMKICGVTQAGLDNAELAGNANSPTKLMQTLLDAKLKGDKLVLMKNQGSIARIGLESARALAVPHSKLKAIIEYALEQDPNLQITSLLVEHDLGRVTVNITNKGKHVLPMPGEDICTGLSLILDIFTGVEGRDFVLRLVCENGMIGERVKDLGKRLNNSSTAEDWFAVLFNPTRTEALVEKYTRFVANAMSVNLSVREYDMLMKHVMSNYPTNQTAIAGVVGDEMSWKREYMKIEPPLEEMSTEQLKNCPTNILAWDAVNLLTWLASHPDETQASDQTMRRSLFTAGNMLYTPWDASGQVFGAPQFEVRNVINVGDIDKYDAEVARDEEE